MSGMFLIISFLVVVVAIPQASGQSNDDDNESQIVIPYEFKNIAAMWVQDKITDDEFLQAVQIRIDQNKIIVPDEYMSPITHYDRNPDGTLEPQYSTAPKQSQSEPKTIPPYIKDSTGYWASNPDGDINFAISVISSLYKHYLLPISVDANFDANLLPPKINYKSQHGNDDIRFSGYRGDLINCEDFSYEITISVKSQPSVPVTIKIISPDGEIVGSDTFSSENHEGHRSIHVNWKNDGTYLIQVGYRGDIYQEDFGYSMTPETFDSYKISCLKEIHITSVREITWTWFSWPNHTQEGFDKNIKMAEYLVRESNKPFWLSFASEENINSMMQGEPPIHDTSASFSKRSELKSILSDGIEQKVIEIFQGSENKLSNVQNISLDQKTDLIFELRAERDQQIINQQAYAEEYVENLYRLYSSAKASQNHMERYAELANQITLQEKEKELQILQEKDAIRQEILSDDKTESMSPTDMITNTTTESICKNSLTLIYKGSDGSAACVKPSTAEKLVRLGWGYYP